MRRVILDTNIYGLIVERGQEDFIENSIEKRRDIVVYGFDVIRKELRASSQRIFIGDKRLRLALLAIYDKLAGKHDLNVSALIKKLALDYYEVYKQLGGRSKKDEIISDFLIIACASLHQLDVVVSEDKKTMFGKESAKAYKIVNKLNKCKTPEFIGYETFRRLLT